VLPAGGAGPVRPSSYTEVWLSGNFWELSLGASSLDS